MPCIKLLTLPQLLFCKFPCGHTNFETRLQGGFNEAQQYSRMCTVPPITEPSLHQDLRPLQAVNNCIGRSEQGAEAEAVGKESQCLRCEVCEPDPPLGSSAYNKLSHLLMFFSQRGLKAAKKAGLEWAGVIATATVNPKLCRMTRFGAARARPKPMTLPVEK